MIGGDSRSRQARHRHDDSPRAELAVSSHVLDLYGGWPWMATGNFPRMLRYLGYRFHLVRGRGASHQCAESPAIGRAVLSYPTC